ncbi:MAG: TetR/AcrR family transcriptional regulator [Lactobacillus sp.]|jgi:AcrR family transcriptional regulator|nr:TetR/AcrR family transcriptional regulator [Lactobacillus sp.]
MKKINQNLIIETSEQLIKSTGTADISLSQIANELGITHAAIYKHFKNKQALWEAVAKNWFDHNIIGNVAITPKDGQSPRDQLHDWLWYFVNAKKNAYNNNPEMFTLNTQYIDNNPYALHKVLLDAYAIVDKIMAYDDPKFKRAEIILSAFTVFTLPNFKDTWNAPDYQERFEAMWDLIKFGL